ncbi:MAG: hypothetical protein UV00_C0030G0001 [candidate division WWE3 bacterium GW2011_GWF1_42_14]|uniref:Uncharacterized protein n=2 Tax=Katanobacteria TaxID=422282 RepID=A0A0G0YGI6_UNCKA|nr:MAG: hypothetical protein UU92_C0025G0007 [candidate division WWE3 bacterium GW2011_GWA1_42_12]KKS33394.1 MAG: hypothetical protein UU97_C0032G0007 [candidate division WWE3 bacterium GW2011_GWD1_42_14]KKS35825.1 MAG: hypothetical protein UV00_C0030G0001 [candidate division WWE3 bacterium GW2011_GWF1_42_14]KKS39602.1 MAG: hypothetical protein UV03_C0027G0001 [candidate division WWE3 bacterium GW2011_GWE1_42_16]KKS65588.1 MAG: hypothetical protein UV35_C0038G0007 [candidate division WWE3 bacte
MYNLIMRNVKIIGIVLLLILLLGGGYFGYKTLKKTSTDIDSSGSLTNQIKGEGQESESFFSGKITDLISLGKSVKCTYTMPEQKGTTGAGTFYVSGTKMRGDSTITMSNNTSVESHIISIDGTMYMWSPVMPRGYKIVVDKELLDTENAADLPEEAKTLQESFDYKCLPWIPDQSLFELPTDVEFVDLSELTKTLEAPGEPDNACALCDLMESAEQKAQCLKSMNCE